MDIKVNRINISFGRISKSNCHASLTVEFGVKDADNPTPHLGPDPDDRVFNFFIELFRFYLHFLIKRK